MQLDIRADVSRAKSKLHRMRDREVNRAAAVAINRTLTTVRKEAVSDVKKEMGQATGISASGLKNSIRMHKAASNRLIGMLVPSGKAIPLINFKARQTKTGVSHKAWPGKSKGFIKGAFIRKMPGGHKGVFTRMAPQYMKRRTKGRPATSSPNLPIKQKWGPSLPGEFVKEKIVRRMRGIAERVWPKNFQKELDYRMSKGKL